MKWYVTPGRLKNRVACALKIALASVALCLLCLSHVAQAQEDADERGSPRATREAKMLSPAIARQLSEAQNAVAEGRVEDGIAVLQKVIARGDRLRAFDRARTYQLLSYAHINREDYAAAVAAAEQALSLEELDDETTLELLYQAANLYLYLEDFDNSLAMLEAWFKQAESPRAEAFFMAAQNHALQEDYQQAFDYAGKGMAKHRLQHQTSADIQARREWYGLLLAIQLNLKLYEAAVPLLREMLAYWPEERELFMQLSAIHQQLQQEADSLAVLSLAQQNGLLSELGDFNRLLQLYRLRNYPYKGAAIFQQALDRDSGATEKASVEYWEGVSSAWLQAREWKRAQTTLVTAAGLSDAGYNWLLLCQTAVQDEHWQQSRQFCRQALDKGGLGADGPVPWQQIALSYYHEDKLPEAADAFGRCASWSNAGEQDQSHSVIAQCADWQTFVSDSIAAEKRQAERLRQDREKLMRRRAEMLREIDAFSEY